MKSNFIKVSITVIQGVSDFSCFFSFFGQWNTYDTEQYFFNFFVGILISSADVLHAWAVPSLGVKADAVQAS